MNHQKFSPLRNGQGFLIVDFLFGFFIIFGMTMTVLFSLTFTLSVAEVVQYITFSSARAYYDGHHTMAKQIELGERKYEALMKNEVLAPLFSNGWFEVRDVEVRSFFNEMRNVGETPDTHNMFAGTRLTFLPRILDIKVPFLMGPIEGEKNPFVAKVATYLGREPSDAECEDFNQKRFEAIQNLGYRNGGFQEKNVVLLSDNGC